MTTQVLAPPRPVPLGDAFAAGIREILPAAIGVIPLAVMIGVTVVDAPIANWLGWLAGPIIVGGSAHLAVLHGLGGGIVSVVAAALLVNARGLLYSAAIAPVFSAQPRWFRLVAPYVLVDQTFAVAMTHADRPAEWMRTYYLTASGILYTVYLTGITVGIVIGPVIAPDSPATLAIPIMFGTILLRGVKTGAGVAAAMAAAAVALIGTHLPAGSGLIAAVVAGTAAGAAVERNRNA